MRGSIEKLKKNKDGMYVLEVIVPEVEGEPLRLGAIEMTQKKFEQRKFGDQE